MTRHFSEFARTGLGVIGTPLLCVLYLATPSFGQGGPPSYGMHEIELKDGVNSGEFDTFVREEFAPAWATPINGLQFAILKGDRGARAGKYQLVFIFNSTEDRDRHFPEEGGTPTTLYQQTMQPKQELFNKLGTYLEPAEGDAIYTDYSPIVPAADALPTAMPTNVRDNINKRLIGNWITEIKEGDEKSQGHMSAMWQPGNASVLIRHTILSDEGTVIVTGLLGWNAKKKQLVHSGQSSNGNIFRLDWTTIDDDKWTGQGQGTHEDGDWTSPVSVMLTGNAFHYEDHARDELFTIDAKRS